MNTHAPMTKLWIQNDTKCIFETICASSCKASLSPPPPQFPRRTFIFVLVLFFFSLPFYSMSKRLLVTYPAFFPPSLLFRALISLKMAIYSANILYFLASFEDNSDI